VPEDEEIPAIPQDARANGLVLATTGPWAFTELDGAELRCRIDERLMVGRSSVLAPGDRVYVEPEGDTHFVRGLGERRSRLSRPSAGAGRVREQVIAANIDLLVIVASVARPPFRHGLVDRYLVAAQAGGVQPLLCVNKIDLTDRPPEEVADYESLGLGVVYTSCETGEGLSELRQRLQGQLSVFAGHSGVGKTTILNRLAPELDLETAEVSDHSEKGRHTTTVARLYDIGDDIRIVDTPGIRQLGLWGVDEREIGFYFQDLAEWAAHCKFRDCTHTHEPECAVRDAVEKGRISRLRYDSYRRIRDSLAGD
jgi:ribosome biogenesis GTPase